MHQSTTLAKRKFLALIICGALSGFENQYRLFYVRFYLDFAQFFCSDFQRKRNIFAIRVIVFKKKFKAH